MSDSEKQNFSQSTDLAESFWRPHKNEIASLKRHSYVSNLSRVDQIWPILAKNYGALTAVNAPHAFHPESYNYAELADQIQTAAVAFQSLDIKPDDVVALFAENSPRWLIVDQAIMRVGAANAVRGSSAPVQELHYILNDSRSCALIVQNASLWEKLSLSDDQINQFNFILQLEGEADKRILDWKSFMRLGIGKKLIEPKDNQEIQNFQKSIATILYTSGTTGQPKGVPLTHSNLLHQIKSLACVAYPSPGSAVLSVLPIWHAYERSAEYYFFSCACTHNYTTIKNLRSDLLKVRPIVMVTVPRLWEAIQSGFEDAVQKMPSLRKNLIKAAIRNSAAYRSCIRTIRDILVEEVPLNKRVFSFVEATIRWPFYAISSATLLPKVLKQLCGGRLVFPINGGGAIAPHIDSFFEALGLELLVGYGLTETSPVVSCRRPWKNIRGSSGPPLPETEFRIVDNETGEIKSFYERGLVLVRGPQVMSGYLGKLDATAKVLDCEGWFNTGDLGMLLQDGSLVLTGRSKDTIVLSSGENIEPAPLEEYLVASELLEQVMLIGQDEKQLGALLVPNVERMSLWFKGKGFAAVENFCDPPGNANLRTILRQELNLMLANRIGSRPDERLIGIALVDPFTIENGLLTQTLKQRRGKISERDQELIDQIYGRTST